MYKKLFIWGNVALFVVTVAAIVAATIIAFNGWRLLRPAVNELMDRVPSQEMVERIRRIGTSGSEERVIQQRPERNRTHARLFEEVPSRNRLEGICLFLIHS